MILSVYSTRIDLFPYNLEDSKTLERRLSVFDWNLHKVTMRLYNYNSFTNILSIPKGFSLHDTIAALKADCYYDIEVVDRSDDHVIGRRITIEMRRGVVPRDEHQVRSIDFLINNTNNPTQKLLNIDTGVGKTFCAISAGSLIGEVMLIIMGRSSLMTQWFDAIQKYTYLTEDDVYIIKGRESIKKLLNERATHKIYIASTETLSIAADENLLDKLTRRLGIGIKITDEAHEMMIANNNIDLNLDIRYNFYLTATPQRSDTNEDKIYTFITRDIPRFGAYTLEINKYTNVKKIFINTYPAGWDQRRCKTRNGFAALIYEKIIFKNEEKRNYFMNIALIIINKINIADPTAKILIILAINNDIEILANLLEGLLAFKVGRFNSRKSDIEKQAELKCNVIISTIKSSGAGLDLPDLRVIINFVPFRSHVMLHQLFGRLRKIEGKAVFYFDIIDEGFTDTMRFANIRDQFFQKKAKSIANINLNMKNIKEKALDIIINL